MRVRTTRPPHDSGESGPPSGAPRARRVLRRTLMALTTAAAVATVSVTGFPVAGKASAQSPSLSLSQSVSPTTVNTVGENATFSFAVTNNGDEPLTGVTVATTSFSGTAGRWWSPARGPTSPPAPR